jgi:hypothetical protein
MGRRSDDSPIYRPRKGPLTQTTINRYLAILGAELGAKATATAAPMDQPAQEERTHRA